MDKDLAATEGTSADVALDEMLIELRILLPSAQLLTAFLITLPFNSGFSQIVKLEKGVFIATFLCSICSLVLFTAPAIQHRLMRPLRNRQSFKNSTTRQMVAGTVLLSLSLILSASLVMSEVFGHSMGMAVGIMVATFIGGIWWIWPFFIRRRLPH